LLQHIVFFAIADSDRGFFTAAGRATRAGFAGWHVLDFDLEVLLAILRASALGGVKSVTILLPLSCVRPCGPLIAAIDRKAGEGTARCLLAVWRWMGKTPFLY